MIYFYITICDKTLEAMLLDSHVLRKRSHLQVNCKCDRSLIVFINHYSCYWIIENTTQYHQVISLNFEYKLYFLHNSHKK